MERGLAPSREKARAMILGGRVELDGRTIEKPGSTVNLDSPLTVREPEVPYVSRGGVKLAAALDTFPVHPRGAAAVDVGASTGGFTECLLRRGAAKVYAIDVGYGQLAWRLQTDPRVVCLDRVNIRKIKAGFLPEECDLGVIDTSFISLKLVLPPTAGLLQERGEILALVKPQFEAGREKVGKGGVVKDPRVQREVLLELAKFSAEIGLALRGWCESPLKGAEGNREFFLHLGRGGTDDRREEIEREIGRWQPEEAEPAPPGGNHRQGTSPADP